MDTDISVVGPGVELRVWLVQEIEHTICAAACYLPRHLRHPLVDP
jgi:hypothetical protein